MKTIVVKTDHTRSAGIGIPAAIYQSINEFIMSTLNNRGEITFHDLLDEAMHDNSIDRIGHLSWYLLQVKRDLEMKGIIKVTMGVGPARVQTIKLVRKRRSYIGKPLL